MRQNLGYLQPYWAVIGTIERTSRTGTECRLAGNDHRYQAVKGWTPFLAYEPGQEVTLLLNSFKRVVGLHRGRPSTYSVRYERGALIVSKRRVA